MLYVEYAANVQAGKIEEYYELTAKFMTLAEEHGVKHIGSWRTAVGQREEVTVLEAYKDYADFEKIRQAIVDDPRCREVIANQCKIRTVKSRLLQPTPYSPLQ